MSLGISRVARDQIVYLKTAGNLFASRAKQICIYLSTVMGEGRIYDMFCTVNDLIDAHFHINASYRLNAPSTLLKLY